MEYILLKALFENKNKELDHSELYKLVENEIGFEDFRKLLTSFHKTGFFDNSKEDLLISNIGINQYNSLKTEKESKKKDIRLTELLNKINVGSGIVNFIFVPLTFALGFVTYCDKTKITELESVIDKQSKTIDSIKVIKPDNINKYSKGLNEAIIDSVKK